MTTIKTTVHSVFLLIGSNEENGNIFLNKLKEATSSSSTSNISSLILKPKTISRIFVNRLKGAMSYPTNEDFISILLNSEDHTEFIKEIINLCGDSEYNLHIVPINNITKTSDIKIEIENIDLYHRCFTTIETNTPIAVIGDIHEHIGALCELQLKLDHMYDSRPINTIFVGDYLDKGSDTEAIIYYLHGHLKEFPKDKVVYGNHESYIVKRLKGKIKQDLELEKKYFSSLEKILPNKQLADKVIDIWDNHSVPFVKVVDKETNDQLMIITHAPVDVKYLGKLTKDSIANQRNILTARGQDRHDYRKFYSSTFSQASDLDPLHVFGHVAHNSNELKYKNKVFLDTGAVYGNKLTSLVFEHSKEGIKHQFVSVSAKKLVDKELDSNLTTPISSK